MKKIKWLKWLLIILILILLVGVGAGGGNGGRDSNVSIGSIQYTVYHAGDEIPEGLITVDFASLGKYDIVDNQIDVEDTIGEYVMIYPIPTSGNGGNGN